MRCMKKFSRMNRNEIARQVAGRSMLPGPKPDEWAGLGYPIEIRLNSATVNPLETLSRYWATVFELSLTNAW